MLHAYRDIAGHERFGCMTHVYYKYAMAALIVFDLTRPATFDAVLKVCSAPASFSTLVRPSHAPAMRCLCAARQWKEDLDSKVMLATQEPVPCLLIANKACIETLWSVTPGTPKLTFAIFRRSVAQCDREDVKIDKERLDGFCKEHNFIGWSVPVVPAHTSPSAPALPTRPTQPALLTRHTHPP